MRALTAVILSLAAAAAPVLGQQTRREVTNVTTPEQDSRPNSPEVPDVYALTGQFEKIVVLRFKHQADLLGGLEQMVKQHRIRNAVILAGAGSLRNYHVHQVSNSTFPAKNVFVKDPTAPSDLISMNGYVIDGRIHVHVTMANPDGAFGGHLERDTTVFTFAIVTLGVFGDGIDLSRADDKNYR